MLLDYIRILIQSGASKTDISYANQDDETLPTLRLASTDCILIGMQYPFNNFFIDQTGGVPNDQDAEMSLEYWDGSKWVAGVDLLDGTAVNGKTLAKSGHVMFSLDRDKTGWGKVNNPILQGPPELNDKSIYDLYWLKLKVSADLLNTTSIRELGFAWTTGQKLKGIKSEVDRYMAAFETGKTNWNKEIMNACKMMVTDLKKQGLVLGPQQVVRLDDFWLPATFKTLWLIYSSLGPAYEAQKLDMLIQYGKSMNVNNVTVDQDRNGDASDWEKNTRVREAVR